jgi:hypothetical protein
MTDNHDRGDSGGPFEPITKEDVRHGQQVDIDVPVPPIVSVAPIPSAEPPSAPSASTGSAEGGASV